MDGKRGKAPCGHDGICVVGQYYSCARCDGKAVPQHIAHEKTQPIYMCRRCMSMATQKFKSYLEAFQWFEELPEQCQVGFGPDKSDVGCDDCGHYWTPSV